MSDPHPTTGGKRFAKGKDPGFPLPSLPAPGWGCVPTAEPQAGLPTSEVKPRVPQGTHWHFYLELGPSTS